MAKASGFVHVEDLVSTQQLSTENPNPEPIENPQKTKHHLNGRLVKSGAGDANNDSNKSSKGDVNGNHSDKITEIKADSELSSRNGDVAKQDVAVPRKPSDFSVISGAVVSGAGESDVSFCSTMEELRAFKSGQNMVLDQITCDQVAGDDIDSRLQKVSQMLNYMHFDQKKKMCQIVGRDEPQGLTKEEMLQETFVSKMKEQLNVDGQRTETSEVREREQERAENKLERHKPGRLKKTDGSLGREYLLSLACKDQVSSSESETSTCSETESETASKSESTSRREEETDFSMMTKRKKSISRRRNNSYRRQHKHQMYSSAQEHNADDEESEFIPADCYDQTISSCKQTYTKRGVDTYKTYPINKGDSTSKKHTSKSHSNYSSQSSSVSSSDSTYRSQHAQASYNFGYRPPHFGYDYTASAASTYEQYLYHQYSMHASYAQFFSGLYQQHRRTQQLEDAFRQQKKYINYMLSTIKRN